MSQLKSKLAANYRSFTTEQLVTPKPETNFIDDIKEQNESMTTEVEPQEQQDSNHVEHEDVKTEVERIIRTEIRPEQPEVIYKQRSYYLSFDTIRHIRRKSRACHLSSKAYIGKIFDHFFMKLKEANVTADTITEQDYLKLEEFEEQTRGKKHVLRMDISLQHVQDITTYAAMYGVNKSVFVNYIFHQSEK